VPQSTEAVYSDGTPTSTRKLGLRDRVHVIVEPFGETRDDCEATLDAMPLAVPR
jgi:hypothetical protein